MMEGSVRSTGWGYIGTDRRGFEWHFTPGRKDPAYKEDPGTGKPYPFCCCGSGEVFTSESKAISAGKRWMKEAGRSGTITAVKPTPHRFEY